MTKLIEPGQTPESMLNSFRSLATKYGMMMDNLEARESRYKGKIEELEKSLEAIYMLQKSTDSAISMDYDLGDTLLAKATVDPSSQVHLWLGANIMLEYGKEEAAALLEQKLAENKEARLRVAQDQLFVREQLTTVEVNQARLYNHLVETSKK